MQGIFQRCQCCSWFTSINLASVFLQLPIVEEDRHKTAFLDAFGQLWKYMWCGFGLKILPPAVARVVAELLSGLRGKGVENYLDDILIYTRDFEQHLTLIDAVLNRLQSARLSVNFVKSRRCCPSLEFVGMAVDRQGIRPADSKIAAVADLPPPSTVEELRAIPGMTGYLRQFVERYSITASPLTDILRTPCFQTVTAIPDPMAGAAATSFLIPHVSPYFLSYSSVPSMGQSVCVAHRCQRGRRGRGTNTGLRGDQAGRRIRHRWSRTDARRRATERECMSVLWAVVHFRPFLTGRQLTLFTDCSALTWLFHSRDLDPKLYRWAFRLIEFDVILKRRPGSSHQLPDASSRLLHPGAAGDSIDDSVAADTSSGNATDYVGPRGPILDG